jgi:hypothetical protein
MQVRNSAARSDAMSIQDTVSGACPGAAARPRDSSFRRWRVPVQPTGGGAGSVSSLVGLVVL